MTQDEINNLLTSTTLLMNHVYWYKQEFATNPSKEHIGSAINYTDIKERKDDFIRELINTINSWVYSKSRVRDIVEERFNITGDQANAYSHLTNLCKTKFRKGHPQGQFGELLLFNFIQHIFKAVPLLRKMPLTTSTGHERFGADAIHYKVNGDKNLFILGESKCYESRYKFNEAFKASVNSIYNTFENIDKELNLYVFDDFIETELQVIAKQYKENTLKNVHFELVCIIMYDETNKISGNAEDDIKKSIKSIIEDRLSTTSTLDCFQNKDQRIIDRINYIIFPFWQLNKVLDDFEAAM